LLLDFNLTFFESSYRDGKTSVCVRLAMVFNRKFVVLPLAGICLFIAGFAVAAEPDAVLSSVSGKVIIGGPGGLVTAVDGTRVPEGARIMVTTDSSVTVTAGRGACVQQFSGNTEIIYSQRTFCKAEAAALPVITPAAQDVPSGYIPPEIIATGIFAISAGTFVWSLDDNDQPLSNP
jgi:hypothetical protein